MKGTTWMGKIKLAIMQLIKKILLIVAIILIIIIGISGEYQWNYLMTIR